MKKLLLALLFASCFAPRLFAQADPCKVFGYVYLVDSPQEADFVVFVDEDNSPDMTVFVPANRLYADKPGRWYFVKQQAFADFRIYITDERTYADFTIEYTETEEFAGCF